MLASMKRAIAILLLVLVLVSMISILPTHGQYVGQACMIDNSTGVCKLLRNCSKAYEELLAGKLPSGHCGFLGSDPIVCCPITNHCTTSKSTPAPSPQPQTTIRIGTTQPLKSNGTVGSVARAKCAENAETVYGLQISSTPTLDREPVDRSLYVPTTRSQFVYTDPIERPAKTGIIGGENAKEKEFPHMVAVGFDSPDKILWNCGGSLISIKVVLTAAHCTWSLDWGNANWVQIGVLNTSQTNDNAKPQIIAIKERINHPDYKRPSEYHDIAILRLEQEVTYNAWIKPACLPVDWPDVNQNDKIVATGWGLVDWSDDRGSETLMKVTLNLVPHESCNASFFDGGSSVNLAFGIVDEWQICAGQDGKDTCQGDSGGPLSVFNKVYSMYTVIGVTSFGRFCGSIVPGVYTRVYHYISWIEKTVWPEYF